MHESQLISYDLHIERDRCSFGYVRSLRATPAGQPDDGEGGLWLILSSDVVTSEIPSNYD